MGRREVSLPRLSATLWSNFSSFLPSQPVRLHGTRPACPSRAERRLRGRRPRRRPRRTPPAFARRRDARHLHGSVRPHRDAHQILGWPLANRLPGRRPAPVHLSLPPGARRALYARTRTERLGTLPLARLRLTANFRSQRASSPIQQDFALIFPRPFPTRSQTPYPTRRRCHSSAHRKPRAPRSGILTRCNVQRSPCRARQQRVSCPPSRQLRHGQAKRDAREILRIARRWFAEPLPARPQNHA